MTFLLDNNSEPNIMRVIESISSALSLSPDIAKTLICLLLSVLLSTKPLIKALSIASSPEKQ